MLLLFPAKGYDEGGVLSTNALWKANLASAFVFQNKEPKKPNWSSLCRDTAGCATPLESFYFSFEFSPKKRSNKTKWEELKIRMSFVYDDHVTKMSPPNPTKPYTVVLLGSLTRIDYWKTKT